MEYFCTTTFRRSNNSKRFNRNSNGNLVIYCSLVVNQVVFNTICSLGSLLEKEKKEEEGKKDKKKDPNGERETTIRILLIALLFNVCEASGHVTDSLIAGCVLGSTGSKIGIPIGIDRWSIPGLINRWTFIGGPCRNFVGCRLVRISVSRPPCATSLSSV